MSLTVGARVLVKIKNRSEYAYGCAQSLDGKTGTIDEVKSDSRVLVMFDIPAKPWSANQLPCKAFWFDRRELVLL